MLAEVRASNPAIQLAGGDASPAALELVRARVPGTELLQMDATRIPFREHFDAVGSFDVIEHIADDQRAVAELAAAVRPGGGVLIAVPQHRWLWSAEDVAGGHKRRYRRRQLIELLVGAGLEPLRTTSYVFSLLPLMAAVRLRRRQMSPARALERARRPVPAAGLMERALAAEVGLIRRGLSFPVGGSLLVVARRA